MNILFKKKAKKIDRQDVLNVIALLPRSVYVYDRYDFTKSCRIIV